MKVNLGTIDVSDLQRRALRDRTGEKGLATRKEIQQYFRGHGWADFESLISEYEARQKEEERRQGALVVSVQPMPRSLGTSDDAA